VTTLFTDFFRMTLLFGIPFTLLLVALYFYSRQTQAVVAAKAPVQDME
jgi:AAT family amino acid transporter